MVTGMGDFVSTPGTADEHYFHYICPGAARCGSDTWQQTRFPVPDVPLCRRHRQRLVFCEESCCVRGGGLRHLVP